MSIRNNPYIGDKDVYFERMNILNELTEAAQKDARCQDIFQACLYAMASATDYSVPYLLMANGFRYVDDYTYRRSVGDGLNLLAVCYKNSATDDWHSHWINTDVYSPGYNNVVVEYDSIESMIEAIDDVEDGRKLAEGFEDINE